MLVSLNWLSQHLDLTGRSPQELADMLTFAGIEVEHMESKGIASDKIVVAQVISFEKHPKADRLRLCQVNDGTGTRQIVCGASNFQPGDKVPLALPGAVMPGDFVIKESELRGCLSQGMMCSGKEIGIGQEHDGLLILDPAAPLGVPMQQLVESDTIFELEITPNRPDCLSHMGVARELAALAKVPLKDAEALLPATTQPAFPQEIVLVAEDRCPFYTVRKISGVKVAPSPEWLQKRLQSIGLRPINNVVDVTNFVLMELGQPLHAFDADKVHGPLTIRLAAAEEKFNALNGSELALTTDDLVIAYGKDPLALAGIMGGAESGVTDGTTNILLESAYFTPSPIRKSSRTLGLSSDSSYRFERGTDPEGVLAASDLATKLILEICGGKAADVVLTAGHAPKLTSEVTLDLPRAYSLLGVHLPVDEIAALLGRLGLKKTGSTSHTFTIPSYRADLQRSVDLVEEIARVHGIQNIPGTRSAWFADESAADLAYDFLQARKATLVGSGFYESQTIKLISNSQLAFSLGTNPGPNEPVPLKNPLSDDHTHLRHSLVPGLLATAANNLRQGAASLRFFESGTVFSKGKRPEPDEKVNLALLMSGPVLDPTWTDANPRSADIYDLRGVIEKLAPGAAVKIKPIKTSTFLLAGQILLNTKPVGLIAQLRPAQVSAMNGRHAIFVAEINVDQLTKAIAREVKFAGLPKFPGTTRDVALGVGNEISHQQFEDFFIAQKAKEPLLESVQLFDLYTGDKVAAGTKSVAYRLSYRDPQKTMEGPIVDAAHQRILDALGKALPVTVR